jgi:hypothetical protein
MTKPPSQRLTIFVEKFQSRIKKKSASFYFLRCFADDVNLGSGVTLEMAKPTLILLIDK